MSRKVYVTGTGAYSSLGNSVGEMFQGLLENRSGVRALPDWKKYVGLFSHLGAPVPEFDSSRVPRTARRTMSRMSEMASLATFQALDQARLTAGAELNQPKSVLIMGSTTGSPFILETYYRKLFEKGGPEGQLGTSFFKVMNHSVPSNVAVALGYLGPVFSPSSACSTSTQAVVLGWELIKSGFYDMVIAGGADELHYTSTAVFDVVLAASRGYNDRPELSPRPFDKKRDGLVVSEGAGIVILESEDRVKSRGVQPLAEIRAGAYICDGSHMAHPQASAMAKTMGLALSRADMKPSEIGYVNAHATATLAGDVEEAQATGEVFGKSIPVSSLKGHMGHSLAACGTLELIACIEMMKAGVLIPNRNLDEIDPQCDHVRLLQECEKIPVRTVMSNNFAFGGMNASLIVSDCSS